MIRSPHTLLRFNLGIYTKMQVHSYINYKSEQIVYIESYPKAISKTIITINPIVTPITPNFDLLPV